VHEARIDYSIFDDRCALRASIITIETLSIARFLREKAYFSPKTHLIAQLFVCD